MATMTMRSLKQALKPLSVRPTPHGEVRVNLPLSFGGNEDTAAYIDLGWDRETRQEGYAEALETGLTMVRVLVFSSGYCPKCDSPAFNGLTCACFPALVERNS